MLRTCLPGETGPRSSRPVLNGRLAESFGNPRNGVVVFKTPSTKIRARMEEQWPLLTVYRIWRRDRVSTCVENCGAQRCPVVVHLMENSGSVVSAALTACEMNIVSRAMKANLRVT